MNKRFPVVFLGWNDKARCLLDAWTDEASYAEVVGVAGAGSKKGSLPLDIRLPRVRKLSELTKVGPVTYLVDLRPPGSTKPKGLPAGVVWIPSEGTQLLERLCRERQALRRYREVVETATDAVVTIDGAHRILFFNQAAEAMFGFKKEEVIGKDLSLIIPPPHKEAHREYVRRYVESRIGRFIDHTVELTAERRSGESFPISISFSVTEEAGHVLMTAVIRDISDFKALQQKALQNERLASMGQALSFVTHEIKNPLVSIGGFARSLLQSDTIEHETRRRVDIIVKEVLRLEELLAEIQDFSKPLAMEKEAFHVGALLREIVALFRQNDEYRRITFSLDLRGDPVVWADPDRLRQVILNLIKNALEAIKKDGKIGVKAWSDDDKITIEIQDNGEGINMDCLKEIFEPFFTTKRGGSGLGLPLCRKIVREHDGDLTITSRAGQGTEARITLPVQNT